jgi:hypothetical protein
MDPDYNLASQLKLVKKIYSDIDKDKPIDPEDAEMLATLVEALDGWMSKGGFLPKRWGKGRK